MSYFLVLALIVLIGIFFFSGSVLPYFAELSTLELVLFVVGGGLVTAYLIALLSDYRGRAAVALRHAAIWFGIFLILAIAYTFRNDLSDAAMRVASETVPPGYVVTLDDSQAGERAVRIRRRANGHFAAYGKVNDTSLHLLVDTGATTVVLRPADAQRAGIDISALSYSVAVQTANGTAYAAPVKLRSVAVGPIVISDVEALVAKPGTLNESLLGMSFLRRLRSYEVSGEFLTLKG